MPGSVLGSRTKWWARVNIIFVFQPQEGKGSISQLITQRTVIIASRVQEEWCTQPPETTWDGCPWGGERLLQGTGSRGLQESGQRAQGKAGGGCEEGTRGAGSCTCRGAEGQTFHAETFERCPAGAHAIDHLNKYVSTLKILFLSVLKILSQCLLFFSCCRVSKQLNFPIFESNF